MSEKKDIFDFDFLLQGTGEGIFKVNIERQVYDDFLKEYKKVQMKQINNIQVEKLNPSTYLLYNKIQELTNNKVEVEEVAEEAVQLVKAFEVSEKDTQYYRPVKASSFYLLGKKKL